MNTKIEWEHRPVAQFIREVVTNLESVPFWLGVLVGSVFGVLVDRIWGKFEQRPKFQIRCGTYDNVNGQKGFSLHIKNIGRSSVPAYRPWLVSPTAGRYTMFFLKPEITAPDEWRVGQTAEFRGPVFLHGAPQHIPQHIANHATQGHKFRFQLVMENSDVSLYSSRRMGRAYVRAIESSLATTPPGTDDGGWGNNMDMQTVHGVWPRIKRVYHRIWWVWYVRFKK